MYRVEICDYERGSALHLERVLRKRMSQAVICSVSEEHLQAAAEIGRTNNISLEKLTELLTLFYQEDE